VVSQRRAGRSTLGCLLVLLLLSVVGYFAVNVGEAYWRFYEFQDAMKQEARFASRRSDEDISLRLRAKADSLGLPEQAAKHLRVRRNTSMIRITSDYFVTIELPLMVRELRFQPNAEQSL
jgi:hypothetical protein